VTDCKEVAQPWVREPEGDAAPRVKEAKRSSSWMLHPSGLCYELVNVRGNPKIAKFDRSGMWGSKLDGRAKKQIFNRISMLWYHNPEVWFYTFTLPVLQHSDAEKKHFKEGLTDRDVGENFSRLLENLKVRHNLTSYVWVAEIQSLNTYNIHYHLAAACRVDPVWLSDYWSGLFGVPDNRNSVDLERVRSDARSVSNYLAGYFSKEGNARNIYTRKHGATRDLTKFRGVVVSEPPNFIREKTFKYNVEINGRLHEMNGCYFNTRQTIDFYLGNSLQTVSKEYGVDIETGELINFKNEEVFSDELVDY